MPNVPLHFRHTKTKTVTSPPTTFPTFLRLFPYSATIRPGLSPSLSPPPRLAPDQISEALQLLAQAVRFLDVRDLPPAPPPGSPASASPVGRGRPGLAQGSGQPTTHISTELVNTLWPMLEAVPGRLGGSAEVIRQLFSLVGKMLASLRGALARQVGFGVCPVGAEGDPGRGWGGVGWGIDCTCRLEPQGTYDRDGVSSCAVELYHGGT